MAAETNPVVNPLAAAFDQDPNDVIANHDTFRNPNDVQPVAVDCITYVRTKLNEANRYFRHPVFGNCEKWPPKDTDYACLHCSETFDTQPVPIPRQIDLLRQRYFVYGIFCSVNCAKAFLLEHEPALSTTRLMYLEHMIRHVYNIHEPVQPAPPRIRLKRYGGNLTLEEFRTGFKRIETEVLQAPFIQASLMIRERNLDTKMSTDLCSLAPSKHSNQVDTTTESMYASYLRENPKKEEKAPAPPTQEPESDPVRAAKRRKQEQPSEATKPNNNKPKNRRKKPEKATTPAPGGGDLTAFISVQRKNKKKPKTKQGPPAAGGVLAHFRSTTDMDL